MRRWLLRIFGLAPVLFVGAYGLAWWTASPDMGARAEGERLARMEASPQWREGHFTNQLPQVDGPMGRLLAKQLGWSSEHQVPEEPIPVVKRSAEDFAALPESGLRATWLGHSTLLVELDGVRVLVDPVWGERASPWTSTGPERWYEMPLAMDELPPLDAVLISHDHYDHLDITSVLALKEVVPLWVVPLGIGAHLELWGVPADRIVELDWWGSQEVGGVVLTSTPARHFSGRWLDRIESTLWTGWAMVGPEHRVYYSGDTAMLPELEEVGERLGPFDLTLIEAGAYDDTWTDVHLGPEQAVLAHEMVRGGVMVPVHWGMFDLGNHTWTEPMERVRAAARDRGVEVRSPRPGESVEVGDIGGHEVWWPSLPYASLEEDPVWSTSVDALLDRWWGPR